MSPIVGHDGYWPRFLDLYPSQGTEPQRSSSEAICLSRWRAANDNAAAQAARSGRVAYWKKMVPQQSQNPGPAAVAWHREAGIDGFNNRRWRAHELSLRSSASATTVESQR